MRARSRLLGLSMMLLRLCWRLLCLFVSMNMGVQVRVIVVIACALFVPRSRRVHPLTISLSLDVLIIHFLYSRPP